MSILLTRSVHTCNLLIFACTWATAAVIQSTSFRVWKNCVFRSVTSLVASHVSSEILVNHYDILHFTHSTWAIYKNVFWKYDIGTWWQKNNWRIWKLKCFTGSSIPIKYSEHLLGEHIWCLFASLGNWIDIFCSIVSMYKVHITLKYYWQR